MKDKKLYLPTMGGLTEFIFDRIIQDSEESGTPLKEVLDSVEVNGFEGTITWYLKRNKNKDGR